MWNAQTQTRSILIIVFYSVQRHINVKKVSKFYVRLGKLSLNFFQIGGFCFEGNEVIFKCIIQLINSFNFCIS